LAVIEMKQEAARDAIVSETTGQIILEVCSTLYNEFAAAKLTTQTQVLISYAGSFCLSFPYAM
jgi:hypothetical protein